MERVLGTRVEKREKICKENILFNLKPLSIIVTRFFDFECDFIRSGHVDTISYIIKAYSSSLFFVPFLPFCYFVFALL